MEAPTQPVVAVIHTRMQPPGVLQQVTIRPDQVKGEIIRFGGTPEDEYMGWVRLQDVEIVQILGRAVEENGKWKCVPEEEREVKESGVILPPYPQRVEDSNA